MSQAATGGGDRTRAPPGRRAQPGKRLRHIRGGAAARKDLSKFASSLGSFPFTPRPRRLGEVLGVLTRGPLGLYFERDAAVGAPVVVAAQAPADVGTEVAPQEADEAEAAPLVDVLLLVAQQLFVGGGSGPHRDQRAESDGVGPGGHGTADPEPVVAVAPDAHAANSASSNQYSLAVRALR